MRPYTSYMTTLAVREAPSPNHSARPNGIEPDMLIVHATAASTFGSTRSWFASPSSRVSAHYTIDRDGTIYRHVDERLEAWHAGASYWRGRSNLNRYSIGIELVNRNDGRDAYAEPQFAALVALSRDIRRRHPIPLYNVVRHLDVSPGRKTDPRGLDWERFIAELQVDEPTPVVSDPRVPSWAHPGDQVYSVVVSRARIRQAPNTNAPTVRLVERGSIIVVDAVVSGERLGGSGLWAHMARRPPHQYDEGFIHLPLLRLEAGVQV